jgi:hypothetical protein
MSSPARPCSPTGSRTPVNRRVETPASIRSYTARVSGSRSAKHSYVETGSSRSSSAERTLGRQTSTRRPPKRHRPILVAMALRGPLRVVLALRADNLINFELHQLVHDPEPDADTQREQSSLAAPTSSPSAD